MAVNVTNAFWDVVKNVTTLDHESLATTESYLTIQETMNKGVQFFIIIQNNYLYFNTINELFYNTLIYCKNNLPGSWYCLQLEKAINKIEVFIDVEDISDDIIEALKF